jgi:hypothetical protein
MAPYESVEPTATYPEAVVERFAFAPNLLTTADVWGSGLRRLVLHSARSVAL